MLKTINMVQGLLSSRRFRRDNGCFFTEKSLKLTPKMTKVPKFSICAHDEVNVHCSPAK